MISVSKDRVPHSFSMLELTWEALLTFWVSFFLWEVIFENFPKKRELFLDLYECAEFL